MNRMIRPGDRDVHAPLEPGGRYQIYPHPDTFRSLTFAGLPGPLRPEFMAFGSRDAVRAYLGIRTGTDAAHALPMAA